MVERGNRMDDEGRILKEAKMLRTSAKITTAVSTALGCFFGGVPGGVIGVLFSASLFSLVELGYMADVEALEKDREDRER